MRDNTKNLTIIIGGLIISLVLGILLISTDRAGAAVADHSTVIERDEVPDRYFTPIEGCPYSEYYCTILAPMECEHAAWKCDYYATADEYEASALVVDMPSDYVSEPEMITRVGAECFDRWAISFCTSNAPEALCGLKTTFCDIGAVQTRPIKVGGYTTADTVLGHYVPDALLWAVHQEVALANDYERRVMITVAMCESGGRQHITYPDPRVSSAWGWFQHLLRYTAGRLIAAGYDPETVDRWAAEVQVHMSSVAYDHGNGLWILWRESSHCWGWRI